MKKIYALYLANAREFLRDRTSMLFVLLLPAVFALFFGTLFDNGGGMEFYLPGLLGLAMLWLGLFGTATPLVEQREMQVLRRFSVTPLAPRELLAAQVSWRVTVGLLQTALLLLVGYLGFHTVMSGNWPLFVACVLVGALTFVSLGYLIACLARSSEGVVALGQGVNFPMMFLSGSFIPTDAMPGYIKPVASLMPLTYLNDAFRQVMVAAPATNPLWVDFAVLGGWLVVTLVLTTRLWRWE